MDRCCRPRPTRCALRTACGRLSRAPFVVRCFATCPYVTRGVLEAMACELPVICTDACHFPEAATQGGGWECEVSIDSVADALVALMSCSDSDLADRGRQARRLAQENYTWDKLAGDLHAACAHLLA